MLERLRTILVDRALPALHAKKRCPLCSHLSLHERSYLDLLGAHLDDAELRQVLEGSDGLCLPHLRLIVEDVDEEPRNFLLRLEARKLMTMLDHLKEFLRKNDHRFSKETITQEEARSWRRAVRIFVGEME